MPILRPLVRRLTQRAPVFALRLLGDHGAPAALAAVIFSATPALAVFIPPNLPAGSQYQLIFVTTDTHDATSTNIADYNAFVTAEAALNPSLPQGLTWNAVGSTSTINAIVNAPSAGLPVYNTLGIEVAATSLYGGNLLNSVTYDQFGVEPALPVIVWTGSNDNGLGFPPNSVLGTAAPRCGVASDLPGFWTGVDILSISSTIPEHFYALSSPITVPEPATFRPLALAFFAIGGIRRLRGWRGTRRA